MGAARWGVLAACLAAVVAVLALVAGAIGEQRRPAPALPAGLGPDAARASSTARGSCAATAPGAARRSGWRSGHFAGRR